MVLVPIGAVALFMASTAEAAAPTYYADLAMFQADITSAVTDDYTDPGYVFIQDDAVMSGVLGETDYMTTGFNNLNIVDGGYYCAGCNGSFQLSFQTTSVGNAVGVNGVGVNIQFNSVATPYFAFITFADGTTADIEMPAAGTFWGVAAPERIESIHFGLSMGGSTTNGSFGLDDLIVGDGNVGGCMIDTDCFDDGDPCTDPVCTMEMCGFAPNVAPCDDGDMCTEMDTCAGGMCGGSPIDCDDGNTCTTNLCDSGAGCIVQLNTDPCDDGDICTEMDVCDAGMCGGSMIDCNDDNVCSVDSCDPAMGCMNEPDADCCLADEDCGEEEVCDLEVNACVPIATGSSDTGGGGSTGDADTGGPAETGMDGTGDGDSGIEGTGLVDTGSLETGTVGSMSGGSGAGADGEDIPPPDFSACNCTSSPPPAGRLWWLMGALGLFVRRRRTAA